MAAAAPVFLSSPASLGHDTGAHPERAERLVAVERELEARGGLGWTRRLSSPATLEQLLRVHPEPYVQSIRAVAARGGGALDADTVMSAGSWDAALHGAGGACEAASLVVTGAAPCAFSAHRPPGHHAEAARAMGFCLFNNVAIAARHAIDELGVERVLILDWDVHHGNGTADIFAATDEVLFVSIHEWPLYPGTGSMHEVGEGHGEGYTVNLPVPGGTGDDVWCSLVAHVAAPLVRAYEPGLVLVSAGFDAHAEDPLAGCLVSDAGFSVMAAVMRDVCGELGVPLAGVLEGGYALGALGRGVAETLTAWGAEAGVGAGAGGGAGVPEIPVHGFALRALERLQGGAWPALGQKPAA